MATTVNNTTVNTKLTIIFDADINSSSTNDGPASGSGNTESDVYLDIDYKGQILKGKKLYKQNSIHLEKTIEEAYRYSYKRFILKQ